MVSIVKPFRVLIFRSFFLRGFKGKRSNVESVDVAQASDSSIKNQFSNDGSFLEQFKKLKQTKDEPPVKTESKSDQEDWYKTALARAKQIAQNVVVPPQSTTQIKSEIQGNKIVFLKISLGNMWFFSS